MGNYSCIYRERGNHGNFLRGMEKGIAGDSQVKRRTIRETRSYLLEFGLIQRYY
jgi:hypothetical protein